LLRFSALCPTRPAETGRLQWSDVEGLDGDYPVLVVSDAKRGAYKVPLSKAAADVLRSVDRDRGPYVFGGAKAMPDQPPKRARAMLKRFADEEAGRKLDWSPKLLRKAPRSWLAERGVPQEVARRLLGHTDPHSGDVSSHYDASAHLARLRGLAEQWAAVVATAAEPPTKAALRMANGWS
jgi:integrase